MQFLCSKIKHWELHAKSRATAALALVGGQRYDLHGFAGRKARNRLHVVVMLHGDHATADLQIVQAVRNTLVIGLAVAVGKHDCARGRRQLAAAQVRHQKAGVVAGAGQLLAGAGDHQRAQRAGRLV